MSGEKKIGLGGALRRYRPYPQYKDSGVEWLGEIPADWGVKRLKRIATFRGGGTPSKDKLAYWRGDIPWVSPKDMKVNLVEDTEDKITAEAVRESATKLVPAGAVLIVVRSGILAHSVPVAIAGRELTLNQDLKAIMPGPEIRGRYLMYLIAGMQRELLIEWKKEGATVESLELDVIAGTPTPIPSTEEQIAIAAFLDRETARIDALVAKKERLIELLEEQRTALIARAVTRGLDSNADNQKTESEAFPSVPSQWEMRKLRRVLSQVRRPVAVERDAEYAEIGIRSWGRGIFHKEPIKGALLEEKSVYRIEPGDFVLNIVFAWEGAVAIATDAEQGMVGSHRFPTFRVSYEVDSDYLLMLLQTEQGRWLMEVNSPGAAGRNKTIRLGQFLDESIPVPPLDVQRDLVARFRERERRLEALARKLRDVIARLKELRTALIAAAVTGKIDVRGEVA